MLYEAGNQGIEECLRIKIPVEKMSRAVIMNLYRKMLFPAGGERKGSGSPNPLQARPAGAIGKGERKMKQDMIVILDLGSTENTVVARAIRDMGVYSEIHPHDITVEELKALDNVKGIILNGGENRVVDGRPVDITPLCMTAAYPVMAIDHPTAQCGHRWILPFRKRKF